VIGMVGILLAAILKTTKAKACMSLILAGLSVFLLKNEKIDKMI
jgi:hypothetical protein